MSTDVHIAAPDQTMQQAAREMASIDAGLLPVGENDRLVGMITDRDITIRGVARGCSPDTPIRQVMSQEIRYCFDDDDVEDAADTMSELQIRRLPVLNHDKRLVGIISLGDIARLGDRQCGAEALNGVSQPGGQHVQA
jgi:CBS domain-containing protein